MIQVEPEGAPSDPKEWRYTLPDRSHVAEQTELSQNKQGAPGLTRSKVRY